MAARLTAPTQSGVQRLLRAWSFGARYPADLPIGDGIGPGRRPGPGQDSGSTPQLRGPHPRRGNGRRVGSGRSATRAGRNYPSATSAAAATWPSMISGVRRSARDGVSRCRRGRRPQRDRSRPALSRRPPRPGRYRGPRRCRRRIGRVSASSPSGTHCTVIASMTWPTTEPEPAGTPRRPNRPTTTWPSSSAGSSSPPDFAVHALSRPPRKKPGPSSRPGLPPELDQQKPRNTRGLRHRGPWRLPGPGSHRLASASLPPGYIMTTPSCSGAPGYGRTWIQAEPPAVPRGDVACHA
jgi:hypothetical protein